MNKLISKIAVLGVSFGMAAAVGVVAGSKKASVAKAAGSDTLTAANFNATGTNYTDTTGIAGASGAVYSGYTAKDSSGNIQMRSKSGGSGIWTTTSGGRFNSATFVVGSGTNEIEVYGSDTAFASYSNIKSGTKIGSVTSSGTVEAEQESNFAFIGITSGSGAIYVTSITIEWEEAGPAKEVDHITLEANESLVKKNYVDGELVSNDGLTVNAYYTDSEDPEDVTSKATITPTPSKVALSTTSISYTATFGGKTSNTVEINGISVEEAPPVTDVEITVTSAGPISKDGVNVTFAKDSGSNAPTWYSAGLRLYAKNTVTVSSESKITGITFNWEQQGTKAFATVTANVGNYSHPSEAGDGVWTGEETEVVFTLGDSGQLQLNTMVVSFGEAPTPKTVVSVDGVATHPSTVALNSSIAASSVTLNVTYSDDSHNTVAATSVTCDTSSLGQKTATAYYNEVGSATFQVEVVKVNPIQELYSKDSGYAVADLKGYYVGALDDKTIVVMDGEYGIAVYNKDGIPVSSYTEGETIVTVSGSIFIFNGLYEISGATVAASSSTTVDKPVTYIAKGGETAEYANRLTNVTGVPALHEGSSWGTAGASDIKLDFTVGSATVLVFYKSTRQNATDYAALKAASEAGQEITIKGFTDWYKGFQVAMNGVISEKPDYTAEQFATELLEATNAKCSTYVDGSSSFEEFKEFFQDVWSTLNAKYVTLPSAQKDVLTNSQASETGDTIQKAMARYDFLTGKYGLSEFISGRVIDYSIYAGTPEIAHGGVAGYVIVISIGTASALAIGLVLMLKKKKHTK